MPQITIGKDIIDDSYRDLGLKIQTYVPMKLIEIDGLAISRDSRYGEGR